MIELQDITKDYLVGGETARILKGITLTVKDGEFVGIVGQSGSGKSTLMHIIGLLDTPTSGKVMINDRDVSRLSDDELSKLRSSYVGFVFQQFNLINKLTVRENITLPAIYARTKLTYDPIQKANELMSRFGILERADFRPNKISGGQQQRVAIARALIMNPQLILADEPTGNLDSKTGEEILSLLKELNNDLGVTIALVTHDSNIAKQTKRHVVIKDGEIVRSKK